jgi:hypothetical protein
MVLGWGGTREIPVVEFRLAEGGKAEAIAET